MTTPGRGNPLLGASAGLKREHTYLQHTLVSEKKLCAHTFLHCTSSPQREDLPFRKQPKTEVLSTKQSKRRLRRRRLRTARATPRAAARPSSRCMCSGKSKFRLTPTFHAPFPPKNSSRSSAGGDMATSQEEPSRTMSPTRVGDSSRYTTPPPVSHASLARTSESNCHDKSA